MEEAEYDEKTIRLMEHVWGEGFLSPGGTTEVDLIIAKAPFHGGDVLDLGCGTGGITLYFARKYQLQRIVGFDVEVPAHQIAKSKLLDSNIDSRTTVEFILGEPGKLPFEYASFDVVFSKDSLIHVEDLDSTLSEIYRVLRQDGIFVGSDWMASQQDNYSSEMLEYLESEGFEFASKTTQQYRSAM